ncbi:hypothetical protein GCM10023080_088270 [Streptomyces pseudoechinosporeus]
MNTSSIEALRETDATTTVIGLHTADDSGLVATPSPEPRLSWSLASARPGVLQHAYEIQVSADRSFSDAAPSGEVESDLVTDHPWPAPPLRSREVRYWRVRVRTDLGWTEWSEPARVEAALLDDEDWTARPVHVPSDRGRTSPGPVPLLRREFHLPAEPVSARLYVTSLGVHCTAVNGRPVSDELLEPGWTSYPNRLLYATYDVTGLLAPGHNAISAAVGDGWYRGHLTWHKNRSVRNGIRRLVDQRRHPHGGRRTATWHHRTVPATRGLALHTGHQPARIWKPPPDPAPRHQSLNSTVTQGTAPWRSATITAQPS